MIIQFIVSLFATLSFAELFGAPKKELFFLPFPRNNAKIDLQDLRHYVKAYCEYFPLSEKDLNAMLYVYVFQLLRSTYGYKEYLLSDSEDREGLISFAFWRTKICKEVLGHIDEI